MRQSTVASEMARNPFVNLLYFGTDTADAISTVFGCVISVAIFRQRDAVRVKIAIAIDTTAAHVLQVGIIDAVLRQVASERVVVP